MTTLTRYYRSHPHERIPTISVEGPEGSIYSPHSSNGDVEMAKLKEEMDDDETERLMSTGGGAGGAGKGFGDDIGCECSVSSIRAECSGECSRESAQHSGTR